MPGQPRTFTFSASDPSPIDHAAGFVIQTQGDTLAVGGTLAGDEIIIGPGKAAGTPFCSATRVTTPSLEAGKTPRLASALMTFDQKLTALNGIMAEWGRTDADYPTRVGHLLGPGAGGTSGGLNGSYFLEKCLL